MAPRATPAAAALPLPRPDGAILRLLTGADGWAEDIPPAPRRHRITVTFSTMDALALHGEAMQLLGYEVAGVRSCPLGEPRSCADLLVPSLLVESRSRWMRALSDRADRVFNLRAGPVALAFGDVVDAHLSAQGCGPTG